MTVGTIVGLVIFPLNFLIGVFAIVTSTQSKSRRKLLWVSLATAYALLWAIGSGFICTWKSEQT